MKTCKKCKSQKLLSCFCRSAASKDGLSNTCKECANTYKRSYRDANVDAARASSKAYRSANPEKVKEAKAEKYIRNKDKVLAQIATYKKNNKEKVRLSRAAYYIENSEKAKTTAKNWRKLNPEKHRVIRSTYRARKKNSEGRHTAEQIQSLLRLQKYQCVVCKKSIKNKYHADHVMPLFLGGSNWIGNIQLLCPSCNHSKNAKHPIDFMQQRGFLL